MTQSFLGGMLWGVKSSLGMTWPWRVVSVPPSSTLKPGGMGGVVALMQWEGGCGERR